MKKYNYLIYGILVGLIIYLMFLRPSSNIIEREIIKRDTIVEYKDIQIRDTVPKLVYVTKIKIDTFKLYTIDSVLVEVQVPIEQKQYTNKIDTIGTYSAWVSGFNPKLDSMVFDLKYPVTTITIDRIKIKKQKFVYGPSIGVYYSPFTKKIDAGIGVSLTYSF